MRIRLLIADDHAVVKESLAFYLTRHADIHVVGLAGNGRIAVNLACELRPDVVLLEVGLPGLNGIEATREITRKAPGVRVLILSDDVRSQSVHDAISAGASGYLSKHCLPEELVQAIACIVEDGTYLSPTISSMIVRDYVTRGDGPAESRWLSLTDRERQVLQLIVDGRTTKWIARDLRVSPKTVDWHKGRMMRKLGIDSIAGLVRYALAESLVSDVASPIGAS